MSQHAMQIMMNAAVCLALSSNFVGAQVVNSDARLLTKQGRGLTAQGVKTIEAGLKESPNDLENRIRLMGYYFGKQFYSSEARNARIAHVLWIIRHHPASSIAGFPESPYVTLPSIRPSGIKVNAISRSPARILDLVSFAYPLPFISSENMNEPFGKFAKTKRPSLPVLWVISGITALISEEDFSYTNRSLLILTTAP